jgi:type IV pilus assembly protein PilA
MSLFRQTPSLTPEKKNSGWPSLGKLTIISILGISGGLVLPSFMSVGYACGCGGPSSEVKQYVGAMNRAQQAYFAENNKFANTVNSLGLGIKTQTTNYNYSLLATKNTAFNYGISRSETMRSMVGGVFLMPVNNSNEMTTVAILCESNSPGIKKPANPFFEKGVASCGYGTTQVRR